MFIFNFTNIKYRLLFLIFSLLLASCGGAEAEVPAALPPTIAPTTTTTQPSSAVPISSPTAEIVSETIPPTLTPQSAAVPLDRLQVQARGLSIGYASLDGRWVIEPQFEDAHNFADSLAAVRLSGKWGFINKAGQMVIEPQFDTVTDFAEGLASVMREGKWGFINKAGQMVIEPQFDYADSFSEGLASIWMDNKYGYINQNGQFVIELTEFDYVSPFFENMAAVGKNQLSGYIDQSGQFLIEPQFGYASNFSEELAVVERDKLNGYINKNGQMVIEPQFDFASNFTEGLAVVVKNEQAGYINQTGQIVIELQFSAAGNFSEGLAAVNLNEKWGYINQTGQMVIEPQFQLAGNFVDGLASVFIDATSVVYIDKTGQVVFTVKPPEQVIIGAEIALTPSQVNFSYDGLAGKVRSGIVPAIPIKPGPVTGSPASLRFTFDDDQMSNWFSPRERQLLIFSADDYRAVSEQVGNRIDALQTLLAERPATVQTELPMLPIIPAAQEFGVQLEYLDFQNGSGIRFISKYAQDASPITNEDIFYSFQGLTTDGKYYITFVYPVSSSILPNSFQDTEAATDYEAFIKKFLPYIQETIKNLDNLTNADYIPDLSLLDGLVKSLQISTEAMAQEPPTPAPVSLTELIRYVPTISGDNKKRDGVCSINSTTAPRPDAWNCVTDSGETFDPCFTLDSNTVLCGGDPVTDNPAFTLNLTTPLPANSLTDANTVWLVELEDGTICNLATEGAGEADGKPISYQCSGVNLGAGVAILGELEAGAIWIAEKVSLAFTEGAFTVTETENIAVRRAWR